MASDRDCMPRAITQITHPVGCAPCPTAQQVNRIAITGCAVLGAIKGLSDSAEPLAAIVLEILQPVADAHAAELRAAGYLPDRTPS